MKKGIINLLASLAIVCMLLMTFTLRFALAGNDDTNEREVGVEWINNYNGLLQNLTMCNNDAEGFYNTIGNNGFTQSWDLGDNNAWERDFESPAVYGRDATYADAVDYVYFAGHGLSDRFCFGTNHDGDGTTDTTIVRNTEVQLGDNDLEWAILSACEVLKYESISNWNAAFDSYLHGMCGFHTSMYDTDDLGQLFAEYLTSVRGPYPVGQAWKLATQADPHQDSSIYGACFRRINLNAYGDPTYDFWNDPAGGGGNEHWASWDYAYTRWTC
jgi:hypothetical protein